MQIDLTEEELLTLRQALDRVTDVLEHELIRTDNPRMQHAAAREFDRARQLRDRLHEVGGPLAYEPPTRFSSQRISRTSLDDRVL